jgi:hypothetical protein
MSGGLLDYLTQAAHISIGMGMPLAEAHEIVIAAHTAELEAQAVALNRFAEHMESFNEPTAPALPTTIGNVTFVDWRRRR